MRLIKCLSRQMTEEVKIACEYAKSALEYKNVRPQLADSYYKIANQELEHATTLHSSAQKIIAETLEKGAEPPQFMLDKWDKCHKELMSEMAFVKIYLDMYR